MKSRKIHQIFSRISAVILFAGLVFLGGKVWAQEEQMGITVSQTPKPGWKPEEDRDAKTFPVMPVAAGILGVAVLSGGAILLIGKHKKKQPVVNTEPPEKPKEKPVPLSVVEALPVSRIPQTPLPVSPEIRPLPSPAPTPRVESSPAPQVRKDSPPPVVRLQPEPAPEPVEVPVVKPSPVNPEKEISRRSVEAQRPASGEDILFKHLDLLNQLKNKENK
jgi:hypothetical protein